MKKISIAIASLVLMSGFACAEGTNFIRRHGYRMAAATSPSGRRGLEEGDDRDCELNQSADEIEFECKSKTTGAGGSETKDEIDFKIKNKDARGLVVKVKYEQEVETAETEEQQETETETETSYEVVFDRIVEYTKNTSRTSTDDAYDWEHDTVLQTLSLANFGAFSPVTDTNTSSVFSVGSDDGLVTFTFTIHRATDGESINANRMKIDFLLENFPWRASNSFVALISAVESKRKVEVEYDDGKKEKAEDVVIDFADAVTGTNGFVPFGSYTWETVAAVVTNSTDANVESTQIRVVATSPKQSVPPKSDDESTTQWVAFSFIGPNAKSASSIYWDPEAGIGYRRIGRRSLVVGLAVGALLLVVVAFSLWFVVYHKGCKKMKSLFSLGAK